MTLVRFNQFNQFNYVSLSIYIGNLSGNMIKVIKLVKLCFSGIKVFNHQLLFSYNYIKLILLFIIAVKAVNPKIHTAQGFKPLNLAIIEAAETFIKYFH